MKPRGANWPPSSYDPETGILYVCAVDRIMAIGARPVDSNPVPGEARMGGPFSGIEIPATGIFAAMDMRTNRIVWRQRWSDTCYSGSVTTAGGLVFVGRNDGRFTALDSSDGRMLWEFQTGAGVNATASVFEHEGTQHVVVYSAGNLFAGSPRGDSVWMFSLDGTMGPAPAPRADAGGRGGAPPAQVPGEPENVNLWRAGRCTSRLARSATEIKAKGDMRGSRWRAQPAPRRIARRLRTVETPCPRSETC